MNISPKVKTNSNPIEMRISFRKNLYLFNHNSFKFSEINSKTYEKRHYEFVRKFPSFVEGLESLIECRKNHIDLNGNRLLPYNYGFANLSYNISKINISGKIYPLIMMENLRSIPPIILRKINQICYMKFQILPLTIYLHTSTSAVEKKIIHVEPKSGNDNFYLENIGFQIIGNRKIKHNENNYRKFENYYNLVEEGLFRDKFSHKGLVDRINFLKLSFNEIERKKYNGIYRPLKPSLSVKGLSIFNEKDLCLSDVMFNYRYQSIEGNNINNYKIEVYKKSGVQIPVLVPLTIQEETKFKQYKKERYEKEQKTKKGEVNRILNPKSKKPFIRENMSQKVFDF